MEQSISQFVETAMTIFGEDVNKRRQLPYLYDGLKPSYRRLIYTALRGGNNYTKVAALVGLTIATTHPHGEASLLQPVSNMVRWGIFDGHGNHGAKVIVGDDIERSAPRYIGARISSKYREFFTELMPYVPYDEAEMDGTEPRYLPTPYPICLTHGTLGIGQGVNTRIPAFTLESIHKAFINDNPNLLEAPFGLILDKENSELDKLWSTGIGRLTYRYEVYADPCDAGYGVFIKGGAELFKPNLYKIQEQIDLGRCYMIDMSDSESDRIFIGKNKGVKAISIDEILDICKQAATLSKTFRLTVTDSDHFYLIPMKKWLECTYNNYLELIERYKEDKIEKLKFQYLTYKWLPTVRDLIRDQELDTVDKVYEKINNPECTTDVISAILDKSMRTLLGLNCEAKMESILHKIDDFQAINPKQRVDEIIRDF